MSNLAFYNSFHPTEVKFGLTCYKQYAVKFNYFINSVINLYLKPYGAISAANLEKIKQEFLENAKLCKDLIISFKLETLLAQNIISALQEGIERAGEVRDLKIKFY